MQDLIQEITPAVTINFIDAANVGSVASIAAEKYVNCENHKYVTFLVTMGTVTTGEEFAVYKATKASGSGTTAVSAPFIGNVYYTNKASVSKTSMVQTSASSSNTIAVDSTNYATYLATVDTTKVCDASNSYITLLPNGNGMSAMYCQVVALMHGKRYQNETGFNVLA